SGTISGIEFFKVLYSRRHRPLTDQEVVPRRQAKRRYTPFKRAACTFTTVGRNLLVMISHQACVKFSAEVLYSGRFEMQFIAGTVTGRRVLSVNGHTQRAGNIQTGLRVEPGDRSGKIA